MQNSVPIKLKATDRTLRSSSHQTQDVATWSLQTLQKASLPALSCDAERSVPVKKKHLGTRH